MDLNQYTQKSLEALRSAQQLAVTHQNQQLEQAHLLLALLRQEGGLVPQLLEKLQRCNFISSLAPYSESGWGGVAIKDYRLPWYRSFEISFAIEVGKAMQPHKSLLGIYYK